MRPFLGTERHSNLQIAFGCKLPQMSDAPRSVTAYEQWHGAAQQFDYFVAALTGAICAYVAQNLKPQRISFSSYALELLALIILIASAYFGFRRIESNVLVAHQTHARLEVEEHLAALRASYRGNPVTDQLGKVLQPEQAEHMIKRFGEIIGDISNEQREYANRSGEFYKWRNRCLYIGFCGVVLARLLSPYV
jgi:hypothetical protein